MILKEVKSRKIVDKDNTKPTNILIEGDNYHALSVLNYTHKGKVDVIYIDPPYNTGATDWKYNNDYVDSNDAWRHSKWIQFIKCRLDLAKNILSDDGVICVTIDDYELPRLWILMEEIFGYENHLGTVSVRNNPKGRMTTRKISLVHEYYIFFGKSDLSYIKKLPEKPEDKTHNYKKDDNGNWFLPVNLRKQGVDSNAENKNGKISDRFFPIYYNQKTGEVSSINKFEIEIYPIDSNGVDRIWRRSKDVIDQMYLDGDIWVKKIKESYQVYFKFKGGLDGRLAQSIWSESEFSASDYGTKILDTILDEREKFQYPKSPFAVMQAILCSTENKNAVVLDFFAGSGTTGHAVMELNKQDGGNRQFILCTNNENYICEEVTYERIKRVMKGYKNKKGETVEGLGGNLRYFKTELCDVGKLSRVTDDKKLALTYRVGGLLALKENTFEETEHTDHWQIFSEHNKSTAVYFSEDKTKLHELIEKLGSYKTPVKLYVFSWSKNEYGSELSHYQHVTVSDIPEPILAVYREINNL